MDWVVWIIGAVVVGAWLLWRRRGLIAPDEAKRLWREGARVIDVRSEAEFRERHLPQAINIPLGEWKEALPRQVPDRNTVLLLHCLSGGRSAIARHQARSLGYARVFNLGSLPRAARVFADPPDPGANDGKCG